MEGIQNEKGGDMENGNLKFSVGCFLLIFIFLKTLSVYNNVLEGDWLSTSVLNYVFPF